MPKPSAVNYFAKNIFQNFLKKIIKSLNGKYLRPALLTSVLTLLCYRLKENSVLYLSVSHFIYHILHIYTTQHMKYSNLCCCNQVKLLSRQRISTHLLAWSSIVSQEVV